MDNVKKACDEMLQDNIEATLEKAKGDIERMNRVADECGCLDWFFSQSIKGDKSE